MKIIRTLFVSSISSLLVVGLAEEIVRAQAEQNQFRGAISCTQCHSSPSQFAQSRGALNRVCLTETQTWSILDRHHAAYDSLQGERAQQMADRLQADVLAPSTGCVQCHNTTVESSSCSVEFAVEGKSICLVEGIGCEACHGPSSRWWDKHAEPAWRDEQRTSPAAKAELGWINVNSPVKRAEVCASCHVGSEKESRVITHEMYAAGHPPLSGFEIESFADKMPRHWRYLNELTNADSESAGAPTYERTRNILVASVGSTRMGVELAMADATAPPSQGRWPELARLDCFACHHELIEPSWRQSRQADATPGRPQLAIGGSPIVMIAAEVAGDRKKSVDDVLGRLRQPFSNSVFGDPKMLVEQGAEVIGWCKTLESRFEELSFQGDEGRDIARNVLRRLATHASAEPCDYDTARQLYGAWVVIHSELVANNAIRLPAAEQAELDSLLARIDGQDPFVLERHRIKPPCEAPEQVAPKQGEQLEANVRKAFVTRTKYDPAIFAGIMAKLRDLTSN